MPCEGQLKNNKLVLPGKCMFVYVAVALWRAIQGKCRITSPSSPALTREPCLLWSVHNSSFSLSLSIISSFSLALNLCLLLFFTAMVIPEAWKNWHTHTHTHTHHMHACTIDNTARDTTPHMHAWLHACTHTHTYTLIHTPCSYLASLLFFSHLDATIPMRMQIAKCRCRRSKMLALCPTGVVQW